jgi:23S rRNA (adenine2503-C2)-methyltransferase
MLDTRADPVVLEHRLRGRISAPVRTPRGRDIDAACGQLKTAAEKRSRADLDREQAA